MDWQKIVIHHTASPTEVRRSGKLVPVNAAMIRAWHKTKGWSDIGYHFVIGPDGRCEQGRPIYRPGAHCNVAKGECPCGRYPLSCNLGKNLSSLGLKLLLFIYLDHLGLSLNIRRVILIWE